MQRTAIVFLFASICVAVSAADAPVPVYAKRPEFVNDLSKQTDRIVKLLRDHSKKHLVIVTEESAARVTFELVSESESAKTQTVNEIASAVAGRRVYGDQSTWTAIVKVCVPAKDHCEDLTVTGANRIVVPFAASDKIEQFVKDNSAALK